MANRIVCGIDASMASGCAAIVAARLHRELGSQAVLVHVEPCLQRPAHGLASIAHARETGRLRAVVEGHGFRADTRVRLESGDPAKELMRAAEAHDAELMLVGARRSAGAAPALGGVAARLARRAPCPVVIAPPELRLPFAQDGLRSVVCAIQESKHDPGVLALGADLVGRIGGTVYAVHAFRASLVHPAAAMLSLAEEMCADLIIVAGEDRRLGGGGSVPSVAGSIAANARCPVMVLPPHARLAAGSGHYEVAPRAA